MWDRGLETADTHQIVFVFVLSPSVFWERRSRRGIWLELVAKIFRRGFSLCGEQEKAFIVVVVVAADSQTIITLTGCNDTVLCYIVHPSSLCDNNHSPPCFGSTPPPLVFIWTSSVFVVFSFYIFLDIFKRWKCLWRMVGDSGTPSDIACCGSVCIKEQTVVIMTKKKNTCKTLFWFLAKAAE